MASMAQNQDAQALGELAQILANYASQGEGSPVSAEQVVQRSRNCKRMECL